MNNELILEDFEIDDFDQNNFQTKNNMFATSNINHAEVFGNYLDNICEMFETSTYSRFHQQKYN